MSALAYSRASQCGDKVRYEARADAKRAAKATRRINGPENRYRVYLCRYCSFFHFGHDVMADAMQRGAWKADEIPERVDIVTTADRADGSRPTVRPARHRILIGIDPGRQTGMAVWDRDRQAFERIVTLDFWRVLAAVESAYGPSDARLVIEDANLNPGVHAATLGGAAGRAALKVAQNVGEVKAETRLLIEGFRLRGFEVETFRPARSKWTEPYFRQLTGWVDRTSSHARDAASFVFGR